MYLKADCVFNTLIQNKIIETVTGKWKIESAAQTQPYNCSFFIQKNGLKSIRSFQISIKSGKHLILKSSIQSLLLSSSDKEKKYIEQVIAECA